ncbi:hypothetical protein FQR65_LT13345 [Abscondita terminalis]|nr:hypothetical protein FQR65_LT13345 [Abscondita terminalis]
MSQLLDKNDSRPDIGLVRQKSRIAGDGMDSEMDDPELMFEPTDLRACRCPPDIGLVRQKSRIAGDGMDSEMDDPELMFEPTDLRACRCPCDHVVYGPGYNCIQVSDLK